mgnify:CR=1 FL=1
MSTSAPAFKNSIATAGVAVQAAFVDGGSYVPTGIGLLLRVSDDGRITRELVSGRVLHHERLRDAILRHLEALLLVADASNTYILSGNGDVIEPDEPIALRFADPQRD